MQKLTTVFCLLSKLFFLNIVLVACSKLPETDIITVKSCAMGDYFWITGVSQQTQTPVEKNYLMKTDIKKDGDICPDDKNKKLSNQKIKITTAPAEICEHQPPCEKDEPVTKVTAIIDYEILK